MEKSERIQKKREELESVFAELSDDQKQIANNLITQASFLSVTLEDLNEKINENGTTEQYTNGKNQSGTKISSDAKLYSNLISKYTAIITKLLKLTQNCKTNTRIRRPETEVYSHIEHATSTKTEDKQSEMSKTAM